MKTKLFSLLKRSLLASAGLVLFGMCLYCIIQANIGVAPWDVFCIGLSNTLHIKYGTASIGISFTIIIVDLLLGEKIGIGTILDAIIIGKVVDLLNFLNLIPAIENNLFASIGLMIVAFVGEGFAQVIYMKAGLSCGPRDALQLGLGKRAKKLSIGVVDIFILAGAVTVGFFLHGPIGIGTLISPFGIGIMQDVVFKLTKFNPKTVKHESIVESFKIIAG